MLQACMHADHVLYPGPWSHIKFQITYALLGMQAHPMHACCSDNNYIYVEGLILPFFTWSAYQYTIWRHCQGLMKKKGPTASWPQTGPDRRSIYACDPMIHLITIIYIHSVYKYIALVYNHRHADLAMRYINIPPKCSHFGLINPGVGSWFFHYWLVARLFSIHDTSIPAEGHITWLFKHWRPVT